MPWDLAESQRISGKCWPKVGGFFANQASTGPLCIAAGGPKAKAGGRGGLESRDRCADLRQTCVVSSLFHVSLVSVYTLLLPEIYGFIYLSPLLTNAREARNKLRAAGASRRETRRRVK